MSLKITFCMTKNPYQVRTVKSVFMISLYTHHVAEISMEKCFLFILTDDDLDS